MRKKGDAFSCVDEQDCSKETNALCAFANAGDAGSAKSVPYLICLDEGQKGSSACADAAGISSSAVETCAKGAQGQQLLTAAAAHFNEKFPGPIGVPHTEVNGKAVSADYSFLLDEICKDGCQAEACSDEDRPRPSAPSGSGSEDRLSLVPAAEGLERVII